MRPCSLASFLLLLLLLPQLGQAQRRTALAPEARVDAVFRKPFASMETWGTGSQISREAAFSVHLLGHLSGRKDDFWGYADRGLTKGGFGKYQNGYPARRAQSTGGMMQRGCALMSIPMLDIGSDGCNSALARRLKSLESLRIK